MKGEGIIFMCTTCLLYTSTLGLRPVSSTGCGTTHVPSHPERISHLVITCSSQPHGGEGVLYVCMRACAFVAYLDQACQARLLYYSPPGIGLGRQTLTCILTTAAQPSRLWVVNETTMPGLAVLRICSIQFTFACLILAEAFILLDYFEHFFIAHFTHPSYSFHSLRNTHFYRLNLYSCSSMSTFLNHK